MDNDAIKQAKERLGERAADIIARGLNIQKWDSRNLKGCCPLHSEKTPSFVWNKRSHSFKCFGCGVVMDILDYYQQTGMTFAKAVEELCKETGTPYENDYKGKPAQNKNKQPYRFPTKEQKPNDAVTSYLSTRRISKKTIEYAGVKSDGKDNIVFEFYSPAGDLLIVKYRPAKKVDKGENKTWCQKDRDTTPLLYGMEKADTTKPLLICEGEIDRLSAIEAGFYNAVSVPFGAGNYQWIEYNLSWLDTFEKIILWADEDEAGQKMIKEVVPRLGEYRCYVVSIDSRYKFASVKDSQFKVNDINEVLYFHGKKAVIELIESAKESPITNIIDMADVESFDINKHEKVTSGIKGLDKWIHGFMLGTVNIITGTNGAGKSTFVNQMCICEPLEHGYKTFVFSAEIPNGQLKSWIHYNLAGKKNIQEVDNGEFAPKGYIVPYKIKKRMEDWYRKKVFFYNNDEDFRAASILQKMEEVARRYGVKNFVLDSLMLINLECSEYELNRKQTDFMSELVKFARKYRAVVHLVAHPRKTDAQRVIKADIAGSGNITNLAHYVIAIYRVTQKEKDKGTKHDVIIDLFKNRPTGFQDKAIGLYYDYPSKRFYGDSDNADREYSWKDNSVQMELNTVVDDSEIPFLEGEL